jgi:hypothetical protein
MSARRAGLSPSPAVHHVPDFVLRIQFVAVHNLAADPLSLGDQHHNAHLGSILT